jgi:prevent-host-death family protein
VAGNAHARARFTLISDSAFARPSARPVMIDDLSRHSYDSYMKAVKIADLKNNLSRHLARVRRGSEITVYDRDTPVARIVPFVHGQPAAGRTSSGEVADAAAVERVATLVRQGVLSPGDPQAVAEWLERHKPITRPASAPSAVDLLLEMRRESTR